MSAYDRFRVNMFHIVSLRNKILGRVDLQKTVYLAQQLGVFIPFKFRWGTYGPYSPELDHSCNFLIADRVLRREGGAYLPGELTQEEERRLQELTSFTDDTRRRFKNIFKDIWSVAKANHYHFPQFMECIASLQFLRQKFRGESRECEKIFNLLRYLKPHRMDVLGPMMNDAWKILDKYNF